MRRDKVGVRGFSFHPRNGRIDTTIDSLSALRLRMSALSTRGGDVEIAADATVSREAGLQWAQKAQAMTKEEMQKRESLRANILRDATLAGTCAGVAGGATGWKLLRSNEVLFTGTSSSMFMLSVSIVRSSKFWSYR